MESKKVFIITGASSGIGAALTLIAIKQGHTVIGIGRREDKLKELEKQTINGPGKLLNLCSDINSDDFLKEIEGLIKENGDSLDHLVLNAGYSIQEAVDNVNYSDVESIFKTNYLSPIKTFLYFKDYLIRSKGHVSFMGSFMGEIFPSQFAYYSGTKAALNAFATGSHDDFKRLGITSTYLTIGFVRSDIRNRDIRGNYIKSDFRTTGFSKMELETNKAAMQIYKAICNKKQRKFIGLHTIILVYAFRYLGFILLPMLNKMNRSK